MNQFLKHMTRNSRKQIQVTVIIEKEPPRQPEIIDLLHQSDLYAQSLYPAESNHLVDLETLETPDVAFFVARHEGVIVGCCALMDARDGTGEIKRMFVDPEARGLKIGRRLLERIETHGRDLGLTAIRLETGIYQPEAIGLYRSAGYAEIEPFGSYLPDPLSLFMEKTLG